MLRRSKNAVASLAVMSSLCLHFPNVVVLKTVGTQRHANERKRAQTQVRKRLGEDAPRVSCRRQMSFLAVKSAVNLLLANSKPVFPGKMDRDSATKKSTTFFTPRISGWSRFGSVTVRLWNGSSGSGFRFRRFLWGRVFLCFSTDSQTGTVPKPVSVPGKRFRRFRFRFRFLEKRFRRFRFRFGSWAILEFQNFITLNFWDRSRVKKRAQRAQKTSSA